MNRRVFIRATVGGALSHSKFFEKSVMTVQGPLPVGQLGKTLIHEHLLVDFIGADKVSPSRWDRTAVRVAVRPYLREAKARGVTSLLDCTPAFLGRDVQLLSEIARENDLHIMTNTGYYGAVDNKYLPPWAFTETDEQLASRWIREYEEGIEGTSIRPGFIKIGVNNGSLSALHQKLVRAAALTHLATGLTICSHTGPALPAFEQLEIIESLNVSPEAFVWVHAQNEPDPLKYLQATERGAWVSLDGMGWGSFDKYVERLVLLKSHKQLHKVLVSHDAGWYRPGQADPMDKFVGYTHLFDKVWPLLEARGFGMDDFQQLLVLNPADAFATSVRKK